MRTAYTVQQENASTTDKLCPRTPMAECYTEQEFREHRMDLHVDLMRRIHTMSMEQVMHLTHYVEATYGTQQPEGVVSLAAWRSRSGGATPGAEPRALRPNRTA
jgi:hypothetical protein